MATIRPSTPGENVERARTGMHETVERVQSGAHEAVERAQAGAHETVERVKAGAHEAVESVAAATSRAADTLSEKGEQIMDAEERLQQQLRAYIRENPMTSIGIAFGSGFILSRLMLNR